MDERVRAVIELGIEEEKARASARAINAINKGMVDADKQARQATESLRRLAEQGAKLREIGSVMAGTGAGILAPLILAANEYVTRYKGLESTANDFAKAQQRSADATSALGRVTASALIPAMNQVATITEKIAAFAQAHPDLVQAAVGAGGALVAGGGALIMAGTAISTVARSAELLKGILSSDLGTAVTKATVGIGALAAGAELAKVVINEYGKATNDQRLATFNLSDALKTGRELFVSAILALSKAMIDAKKTLQDMGDIIGLVWAKIKAGFEKMLDDLATGIRIAALKLQDFINKLYDNIQQGPLGKLLNMQPRTSTGPSIQDQIAAENDQLGMRAILRNRNLADYATQVAQGKVTRDQDYQKSIADLGKFGAGLAGFAETGSLGPTVDKFVGGIKTKLEALLRPTSGAGITTGGAAVSPEVVNAYIARQKALATSDRQFAEEQKNMKYSFNVEEAKATREKQANITKINADFMRSEIKATQEYQYNELKEQSKYALERRRVLQDLNDNLLDLAAKGDVSSFIQAQKAAEKQLRYMDQDQALAAKERQKDFLFQRQEARQEREYQLQDLETSFARDKDERQRAYNEQLIALRYKHDLERQEIDRAFAEQIATLQGNYANLQAIHDKFYAGMAAQAQSFITQNASYLQSLLSGGLGTGGSTYTSASRSMNTSSYSSSSSHMASSSFGRQPGFAGGLSYVPRDMLALVHQGEKIVPASMNSANRDGGRPITIQNLNLGRIASPEDVAEAQQQVVNWFATAANQAGL